MLNLSFHCKPTPPRLKRRGKQNDMKGNAKEIPTIVIRDLNELQTTKAERDKLLIALKIVTARLKKADWLGSARTIEEAEKIIQTIEKK